MVLSRRRFLVSAASLAALPTIIPASALGREDRPAASHRITMGMIGCGGMGLSNTRAFLAQTDCQVVAACDVDKNHLQAAIKVINQHYGNNDCKAYHDFRELLDRRDIDAVMIAVPDHWHAIPAIEAARKKKRYLRRKAAGAHDCGAAGDRESSAGQRSRLADRIVATFAGKLPQSSGNRAQWMDRKSDAR